MATYKVLQDIEAEDTLIGPLTLRQCLYAAIGLISAYLGFVVIVRHVAYLVIPLLPFMAFGFFFAFPWSKQQSTEVWALAKVRFYFKPRKRIWNQTGVKELVTITVPKTIKKAYGSSLSPVEVTSRLKALADTIDSRGWAIKNVDLSYFTNNSMGAQNVDSDRLVDISNLPQDVSNSDAAAVDMFDVQKNPIAQKLDAMMSQSADTHHQQIVQQLIQGQQPPAGPQAQAVPGENYWHLRNIPHPDTATTPESTISLQPTGQTNPYPYDLMLPVPVNPGSPSVTPASSMQVAQTQQTSAAVNPTPVDYSSMRIPGLQPAPTSSTAAVSDDPQPPVTAPANPAILELANNNDLNVATIAREAQARSPELLDEVVVSLH